jgi:hypothetical protein
MADAKVAVLNVVPVDRTGRRRRTSSPTLRTCWSAREAARCNPSSPLGCSQRQARARRDVGRAPARLLPDGYRALVRPARIRLQCRERHTLEARARVRTGAGLTADLPYLKITLAGSDGTQPEKPIGTPIRIAIPRELSLRIATMHVMEFVMKEFKRIGFKDALKAIGLK